MPAPGTRFPQRPSPVPPAPDPPKGTGDLTLNKLLAGAGAAATSALVGSFFGAQGTVVGAAVGSVVTTVATALYERSLDRTRDTVKARIRLPGDRTVDVTGHADVPAPRVSPEGEVGRAQVYVSPAVPRGRRTTHQRLLALLAVTGAVFALGLLLVTGLELVAGSPLNGDGDPGTSLGRVLDGAGEPEARETSSSPEVTPATSAPEMSDTEMSETSEPTPSPTEEPSPTPDGSAEPSDEAEPSNQDEDLDLLPDEAGATSEQSPAADATEHPESDSRGAR